MSTNQAEQLTRAGPAEALAGAAIVVERRLATRRGRRRRPLRRRRTGGKGIVPPSDHGAALALGDGSDAREFLQRAIVEVGPRVLAGRPMLALFAFVKGMSEILADRWPPLRHEQACELVKQILRQGGMGLSLLAASECHPLTGWVLNSAEQQTHGDRFVG